MEDLAVVFTVVIENWNRTSAEDNYSDEYESEYISTILNTIRGEDFNHCTIQCNTWGESYISLGEDENGIWASARYFPGSDQHGNGGDIPQNAQDLILRIEEEFKRTRDEDINPLLLGIIKD